MDYMRKGLTPQDRIWWFDHENGKDKVYIRGYYYFATGARRGDGFFYDAPTNEVERNRLIAKFWEEKTRLMKQAFDNLRLKMRRDIEATNAASDSEYDQLKALKEEFGKCEAKLQQVRATFPENDPKLIRKKQEIEIQCATTRSNYMSKLDDIKI
jgi:hypothetical protein